MSGCGNVTLDDGTVIVLNGSVVPGAPVVLAIVDFLARGGDCYPLREVETTRLGVTYQQALAEYIAHDLGGVIGAADYPTDGGDRITALAPTEAADTPLLHGAPRRHSAQDRPIPAGIRTPLARDIRPQ